MQNPWTTLKDRSNNNYLADCDLEYQPVIDSFNSLVLSNHKIRYDFLPQPYAGSLETAEVVLLNLNPGFAGDEGETKQYEDRYFFKANLDSLTFQTSFYFLESKFEHTPAYRWWHNHLKEVINCWKAETTKRLMVIEYFPYHSQNYKPIGKRLFKNDNPMLPSQYYSFYLVRKAMHLHKKIIVMRSFRLWQEQIPELQEYKFTYKLGNPQNPCVSEKNMPSKSFKFVFSSRE